MFAKIVITGTILPLCKPPFWTKTDFARVLRVNKVSLGSKISVWQLLTAWLNHFASVSLTQPVTRHERIYSDTEKNNKRLKMAILQTSLKFNSTLLQLLFGTWQL